MSSYTWLEASLGVGLPAEAWEQALTHRSYAYENGGLPTNERLEFLGDAVLGLVVTDAIYRAYPELAEGQLAKMRAAVVSTRALAGIARTLGLGRWLRLGKGEDSSGGRDKDSILADTTEALLGAIFLERGLSGAEAVVMRLVGPLLAGAGAGTTQADWKTTLQEATAAAGLGVPSYLLQGSGPDHARHFAAEVTVAGRLLGAGSGATKKAAEQVAAELACSALTSAADIASVAGSD